MNIFIFAISTTIPISPHSLLSNWSPHNFMPFVCASLPLIGVTCMSTGRDLFIGAPATYSGYTAERKDTPSPSSH